MGTGMAIRGVELVQDIHAESAGSRDCTCSFATAGCSPLPVGMSSAPSAMSPLCSTPAPAPTIGSGSTLGTAATTLPSPPRQVSAPWSSEVLCPAAAPSIGRSSSSSMSSSSESLSTSSGVIGLAKLCTVGSCFARFLPSSHANASACQRSRTGVHCHSQFLVKSPVFPVGLRRSTLAGIFHASGCAA